jgi:hypothetical protein
MAEMLELQEQISVLQKQILIFIWTNINFLLDETLFTLSRTLETPKAE